MDIADFLTSGTETVSGKGLHQRKVSREKQAKLIASDVVKRAVESNISTAAEEFNISEASVGKYLSREIKKNGELLAQDFICQERMGEIESFIRRGNSTSVKRMIIASEGRFTEAEIRIVKACIEKRGAETWES